MNLKCLLFQHNYRFESPLLLLMDKEKHRDEIQKLMDDGFGYCKTCGKAIAECEKLGKWKK